MSEPTSNILFGIHADFQVQIERKIDTTRFQSSYGHLSKVSFDGFDAIIPLGIGNYRALRARIAEVGNRSFIPDPEAVALADDKYRFNKFLLGTEYADLIPPVYDNTAPEFPFMLKKKTDEAGVNSFLIRTAGDLEEHKDKLEDPDYFTQFYLTGENEHTTHIFIVDGTVRYFQNVVYDMGEQFYVKKKGVPIHHVRYHENSALIGRFEAVLNAIGFKNGICCFNYKYHNGKPMVFELNPRFGSSLCSRINDVVAIYLKCLAEQVQPAPAMAPEPAPQAVAEAAPAAAPEAASQAAPEAAAVEQAA